MANEKEVERYKLLVIHKQNIIRYGSLFCEWLIEKGNMDGAKTLYLRLLQHDNSKFEEYEWEHLWHDEPKEKFETARKLHWKTNAHHPEFWCGSHNEMSHIYLMEMVADWYSRMKENGEPSFGEWLQKAKKRYKFTEKKWAEIMRYAHLIVELDEEEKRSKRDDDFK
jgi:hypothetical protein